MKEIEAELMMEMAGDEDLYFKLKGGGTVKMDDVGGADWRDNEGQIEAAFAVARAGEGKLICLSAGDDHVWLTTSDKIKKPRAKVKRKKG